MRAHLWDPGRHVVRATFPTLGRVLADQTAAAAATEASIAEAYRTRLS